MTAPLTDEQILRIAKGMLDLPAETLIDDFVIDFSRRLLAANETAAVREIRITTADPVLGSPTPAPSAATPSEPIASQGEHNGGDYDMNTTPTAAATPKDTAVMKFTGEPYGVIFKEVLRLTAAEPHKNYLGADERLTVRGGCW